VRFTSETVEDNAERQGLVIDLGDAIGCGDHDTIAGVDSRIHEHLLDDGILDFTGPALEQGFERHSITSLGFGLSH